MPSRPEFCTDAGRPLLKRIRNRVTLPPLIEEMAIPLRRPDPGALRRLVLGLRPTTADPFQRRDVNAQETAEGDHDGPPEP